MDGIEELIFTGYPDGWADEAYEMPITLASYLPLRPSRCRFRRMIRHPSVYGSVFGGSSRSPLFRLQPWDRWPKQRRSASLHPAHPGGNHGQNRRLQRAATTRRKRRRTREKRRALRCNSRAKELDIGFAFNDKAIAGTINQYLKSPGLPKNGRTVCRQLLSVCRPNKLTTLLAVSARFAGAVGSGRLFAAPPSGSGM